jgi:hypothetical protein
MMDMPGGERLKSGIERNIKCTDSTGPPPHVTSAHHIIVDPNGERVTRMRVPMLDGER